jgi:hypothetical protein
MEFSLANITQLSFFLSLIALDDAIVKQDDKEIIAILDLFLAYWIMQKEKGLA